MGQEKRDGQNLRQNGKSGKLRRERNLEDIENNEEVEDARISQVLG